MVFIAAVDIDSLLKSVEMSALAVRIRDSLLLFPLIESTHVFGLALVFGTIVVIDLRLLGIASIRRPFRRLASDILKWTWAAFALTALTGALMFTTNARVYYHNIFFRTKMLLLLLTGINMLIFELTAGRVIHRWISLRRRLVRAKRWPPCRSSCGSALFVWVGSLASPPVGRLW